MPVVHWQCVTTTYVTYTTHTTITNENNNQNDSMGVDSFVNLDSNARMSDTERAMMNSSSKHNENQVPKILSVEKNRNREKSNLPES